MKTLHSVPTNKPPINTNDEIYAPIRARIKAIDWKALWERKREPVELPDRRRRGWVK